MSFWGIRVPPRPVALVRERLQSLSEATRVDVAGFVLKVLICKFSLKANGPQVIEFLKGKGTPASKYVELAMTWPLYVWHCCVLVCQKIHASPNSFLYRDLWLAEVAQARMKISYWRSEWL